MEMIFIVAILSGVFFFCLPLAQIIVRQVLKLRKVRRRQFWPSWQEILVALGITAGLGLAMYLNGLFD